MLPTPRADVLIVKVRETLQLLRELSAPKAAFDPASSTRTFCICMPDASHITMLPKLLAHLRAVAPNVQLVAATIDANTEHAQRYHGDAGNRWLRNEIAGIYISK